MIVAPAFPQKYPPLPCGPDPELFQPPGYGIEFADQIAEAKAVCAGCPARWDCLSWAVDAAEPHGIWGGYDPMERKRMRLRLGLPDVRATHHGYFDEKGRRVDKHGRRVS